MQLSTGWIGTTCFVVRSSAICIIQLQIHLKDLSNSSYHLPGQNYILVLDGTSMSTNVVPNRTFHPVMPKKVASFCTVVYKCLQIRDLEIENMELKSKLDQYQSVFPATGGAPISPPAAAPPTERKESRMDRICERKFARKFQPAPLSSLLGLSSLAFFMCCSGVYFVEKVCEDSVQFSLCLSQ